MWNFIKKYWTNNYSNVKTYTKDNSITFIIDDQNKIHLKIDITNVNEESSQKFGLLLFLINEGYYVQSILDMLMDLGRKNANNALFTKQSIDVWSSKIIESDNNLSENDPIVPPTQFGMTK